MKGSVFTAMFADGGNSVRGRIIGLVALVVAMNLAAWGAALGVFRGDALLLGSAVLAYSLGLRHAIDADHIAAIDNVTRKLVQEGKRPVGAGFFFSLGHSTIVVLLSLLLAATAAGLKRHLAMLSDLGSLVGVAVSTTFLFMLAAMNMAVLVAVLRAFRHVRGGGSFSDEELNPILARRGLLGRIFGRLFALVNQSWHMYPIGLLFGLGFDTATEVGLLGLSAAGATHGLNIWAIMVFPALFTAGMSLLDTADSILMLGAYRWSFVRPLRKLYYNLTITAVSVAVALLVGGVEALGLLRGRLGLAGPFWDLIGRVSGNFGLLGGMIIALFAGSWIISMLVYRLRGYDRIAITPAE